MTGIRNMKQRSDSRRQAGGFAMLMVLMLLAMSVVLGLSYLMSTSVKSTCSANLLRAAQARYLAESGLQHALLVLRTDPTALESTSASRPAGPYYLDNTSNSYSFYAVQDADTPSVYYLTATATVDGARQQATMKVLRSSAARHPTTPGVLIDSGLTWLPSSVTINGPYHINGDLWNFGTISGNVSATGRIYDLSRGITQPGGGSPDQYADPIDLPDIDWRDYLDYTVNGVPCEAALLESRTFDRNNSLANGGAISTTNLARVVYLRPSYGNSCTLPDRLNFTGTLLIDGNLLLDGKNIELTAMDGFPALIVTGYVYVIDDSRVTINGLVYAGRGFRGSGNTRNSRTEITGGLVCLQTGYDFFLDGDHRLTYDAGRCEIYDLTRASSGARLDILETGR